MYKIFAFFFALLLPFSAFAARPWVSGEIESRLYVTNVNSYKEDAGVVNDKEQEVSNVFVELYPSFALNFNDSFSIKNTWQLLVLKGADGEDRILEDEGFVLEEFFLNYADDQADFFIGKFNPKFAYAWDLGHDSGIWGNDLAEEYRITGKLGLGFAAKFNLDDFGKHSLHMSSFYDDSSAFDDSLITKRDRTENGLGDMSDTGSLSSYVISIHGSGLWFLPSAYYNVSYRNLEGTSNSLVDQEDGYSLGIGTDSKFFFDLKFTPYMEYVNINGFNSFNNRFNPEFGSDDYLPGDAEYLSLYLPVSYRKWHFRYIVSHRKIDANEVSKKTGTLTMDELSISYEIFPDFLVTLGRRTLDQKDEYESSETGVMLKYNYDF